MNNENIRNLTSNPNRMILPLLCVCSFSSLFNMRVISPILVDISQDFDISVAVAGSLGAAYSLPAAFLAWLFGPLSDRLGRRTLIIFGLISLIVASVGATFAPTFALLVLFRVLAGLGSAALQPAVFAAVGDYFPYEERGRAFGWVVTGTTMAVVLGLPAGSLLAGYLSWRWVFGLLALIFFIVNLLIIFLLPPTEEQHKAQDAGFDEYFTTFGQILRNRSTLMALISSTLFGLFWQGWNTFSGAFFIQTFGIRTEALAPIYVIQGIAIVLASRVGGILSDRITKKAVASTAMLFAGLVMFLLTNIHGALWLGIALNTLMAVPASFRFVSGNALISELVPSSRGMMTAMNSSANQVGTMMASALGGFTIEISSGYGLLGLTFGTAVILGAFLLRQFVIEGGTDFTLEAT
jgi:multidrug resistance protein